MMIPEDRFNGTLSANVHPGDWENPYPRDRYNLVVIGGGTAGLVSAAIASSLGARTALVERDMMGGDCLNVGCVPSKGIIRGARASAELAWLSREQLLHDDATQAYSSGSTGRSRGVSFSAVMERMRRIRAEISTHDSPERYRREFGVDVYVGNGTFTGGNTATVTGDDGGTRHLTFSRAIIATGARAAAPPIPGIDRVSYLTNETLFSLTEPPDHLVVIGAGPIGCEMSQSFSRLGSTVTLIEMAPRVLPREDPDASAILCRRLEEDGVRVLTGVTVTAVERASAASEGVAVHLRDPDRADTVVTGTHLLVAIGRKPNLDGLGLDAAGVHVTPRGVPVNDRLRTSNRRIFAAGDVAVPPEGTAPMLFTHTAEAGAGIAVQNALFFSTARVSRLVVPWTTYTSPEVAHVGISEQNAAEKNLSVDVYHHPMSKVDRARLEGETEGFVKLITPRGGRKILGATVVSTHAGEAISEIVLAIKNDLGVDALSSVIHPYPTQAEAVKRAATGYLKKKLTSRARRLMEFWFRIAR